MMRRFDDDIGGAGGEDRSYYERQAARQRFADDLLDSIGVPRVAPQQQQKQQQPRYRAQAARTEARTVTPRREGGSRHAAAAAAAGMPRGGRGTASRAGRGGGAAAGAGKGGRGDGSSKMSKETYLRQGAFLFKIKGMRDRRDFDGVLRELHETEKAGPATLKMYSCCIGYMGKGGNWRGALGVLDRIRAAGRTPDAFCVNDAMNACIRSGKWSRGLDLLDEARGWGTELDAYVFSSALTACARGVSARRPSSCFGKCRRWGSLRGW